MESSQAQEELQFIKQIMEESRKNLVDNGQILTISGILASICVLGIYGIRVSESNLNSAWFWGSYAIFVFSYSAWRRHNRPTVVSTFSQKISYTIWGGCGIAMTLIGIIGSSLTGSIPGWAVCPLCCIIMGIGYFTSGMVFGEPWIRKLALAWWIGGALMFWIGNIHTLALFAIMMIAFQVIPGMILHSRWKQQFLHG